MDTARKRGSNELQKYYLRKIAKNKHYRKISDPFLKKGNSHSFDFIVTAEQKTFFKFLI
jgi:hypothetical protein